MLKTEDIGMGLAKDLIKFFNNYKQVMPNSVRICKRYCRTWM